MKKVIAVILSLHFILAFNCNGPLDDNCLQYQIAPISNVNAPATGQVNTTIPIPISYSISNGCGRFHKMEDWTQGNNINITIYAKYEGCICTMVYSTLDTVYNFRPPAAGTYYLNFRQSDSSYISDTINIQ